MEKLTRKQEDENMSNFREETSHTTLSNTKSKCSEDEFQYTLVTPPEEFMDHKNNIHEHTQNISDKTNLNLDETKISNFIREGPTNYKTTPVPGLLPEIHLSPSILASSDSISSNHTSPYQFNLSETSINSSPASLLSSGTSSINTNKRWSSASSKQEIKNPIELEDNSNTRPQNLLGYNKHKKTRDFFLEETFNVGGLEIGEDRKDRKYDISQLEKITQELYITLVTKLEIMREEERCLELERDENEMDWQKMGQRLQESAPSYTVEKFNLHGSELEKIVNLILCLTGRLVKVANALDTMAWNGVDERFDLEQKRDKLSDQMDEAKLLWNSIDKRTGIVAGHIEQYLSKQEGVKYLRMIKRKVKLMLEMKEIQEKLELCGKQMNAIKML
jgi:hypothetical protein